MSTKNQTVINFIKTDCTDCWTAIGQHMTSRLWKGYQSASNVQHAKRERAVTMLLDRVHLEANISTEVYTIYKVVQ